MIFKSNKNKENEEKTRVYFNEKLNSFPLSYRSDSAYKNIHEAALIAKEFIDYGLESQKQYKEKRKSALEMIDYFSKTVEKFYTKKLDRKEYNYLLNTEPKKILKKMAPKLKF